MTGYGFGNFFLFFFCITWQGPAKITVTGIDSPFWANILVIPTFSPNIPATIFTFTSESKISYCVSRQISNSYFCITKLNKLTSFDTICLNKHPINSVSYTHLRAHETRHELVCRLLLEKKKKK